MAVLILYGTTRMSRYQKKHPLTHTYRGHQSSFICFLHLLRSMVVQFTCLTVFFHSLSPSFLYGLLLGMASSTSYSIHFFTQSLSSFRSTRPYHRNLFCCSTKIMLFNPRLSLNLYFQLYLVASRHTSI